MTKIERAYDNEARSSVQIAMSRPTWLLDCIELEEYDNPERVQKRVENFCKACGMKDAMAKALAQEVEMKETTPFEQRADKLFAAVSPLLESAPHKKKAVRFLADFVKTSEVWQENLCDPVVLKNYMDENKHRQNFRG